MYCPDSVSQYHSTPSITNCNPTFTDPSGATVAVSDNETLEVDVSAGWHSEWVACRAGWGRKEGLPEL